MRRVPALGRSGLTEHDRELMERALDLAERAAAQGQEPFGSVLAGAEGRLLGEGHNTVRADRDPTAHGEIAAIRDAWRRTGSLRSLAGATLYTSCEPCLSCSFVVFQVRLGRVVFAASGADIPGYRPLLGGGFAMVADWVNAQDDWPSTAVHAGLLRDRGVEILRAFPWDEREG